MKPPYPSLTSEWHDKTYPAIDPKRSELSAKGKTIVISGGGSGIGRGIAQAFALAGASAIATLGRRQALLEETKQLIASEQPGTTVSTHITDVTDSLTVQKAAREVGQWDVLVSNAGYLSSKAPLVESDEAEWWRSFEVRPMPSYAMRVEQSLAHDSQINVKGSYNLTKAFMPSRKPHSTIISGNAGSIQVPGPFSAGFSSYNSSKLAVLKMFEILAVENPDVHVVSMHPGVVDTEMKRKNDMPSPHMDAVELPSPRKPSSCAASSSGAIGM
ncbi:hypothetical protein LTR35_006216 [Friedmanniomyces endolithicus]|uniref:Uncharacterized protein n=1 Tax=Friedmanniomyces endolithicus TaxID=329885 RepID=A0AAN6FT03_9PEZI|nr:hypothetical protein LTR35_006216 [Friedmanniomyces endolithicus]KAK0301308.1 hypothetical protein LTS00_000457 [Friedmanniomyces endolithicus]KAK0322224.1 hypothetical protein LTR82_006677 [Friedmanniomyces endolithicus]KAK1014506.1 hypothetical protein LTR54_004158 [Friedmanniomyces endolithicus]